MPIYEYRCEECGHQQEVLQKVGAEPLTECPVCGKSAYKKLVSAAAFHLKGTGWYKTDFRDSGKPKKADKEADKPAAKAEGGKDSGNAASAGKSAGSGAASGGSTAAKS